MGLKPRQSKAENQLKTEPSDASVDAFLDRLADPRRRAECDIIRAMMSEITGEPATMWGASIVGFGSYHYQYASGRAGDWPRVAFSPRKAALTVYCMPGFKDYQDLLARLGRHKHSVSCLYLPRLDEVDLEVLRALIARSVADMAERYPL